jgi:hypothetical protein
MFVGALVDQVLDLQFTLGILGVAKLAGVGTQQVAEFSQGGRLVAIRLMVMHSQGLERIGSADLGSITSVDDRPFQLIAKVSW